MGQGKNDCIDGEFGLKGVFVMHSFVKVNELQEELAKASEDLAAEQAMFEEAETALGVVRRELLGEDRHHNHYYFFPDLVPLGVMVHQRGSWAKGTWGCYTTREQVDTLIKSLFESGRREGKLFKALQQIYSSLETGLNWAPLVKEGEEVAKEEDQEASASASTTTTGTDLAAGHDQLRKSTRQAKKRDMYVGGGQTEAVRPRVSRNAASSRAASGSSPATQENKPIEPEHPMRRVWTMSFHSASNPLSNLQQELLDIEENIMQRIKGSTVYYMCSLALPHPRNAWHNRVLNATDHFALADLLLELEDFYGQAIGVPPKPLDESIRIWRMVRDGTLKMVGTESAGDEEEEEDDEEEEVDGETGSQGRPKDSSDDEEGDDENDERDDEGLAESVNGGDRVDEASNKSSSLRRRRGRPRIKKEDDERSTSDVATRKAMSDADDDDVGRDVSEVDLDRELAIVKGALVEPDRLVWRGEVAESRTIASLAFCLYSFVSQANHFYPIVEARVHDVNKKEKDALAILSDELPPEGGQLPVVPTTESTQVGWARFPRANKGNAFWPAVLLLPVNWEIKRLLDKKKRKLVRFIGETQMYHMPEAATHWLPFKDAEGQLSVQVTRMRPAIARRLRVAGELWERWVVTQEKKAHLKPQKPGQDVQKEAEVALPGADANGDDSATDTDDERPGKRMDSSGE